MVFLDFIGLMYFFNYNNYINYYEIHLNFFKLYLIFNNLKVDIGGFLWHNGIRYG